MSKSKIYTRRGDDGTSSVQCGERLSKGSPIFEALGVLDELDSFLGLAKCALTSGAIYAKILRVQGHIYQICAHIGVGCETDLEPYVRELEREIDAMSEYLSSLHTPIIPGGEEASARIHVCRTVCRRAERVLVSYGACDQGGIRYINRLSDWLFVVARYINYTKGSEDVPTKPGLK